MLEAIRLDEQAIATRPSIDPAALIHSAVSLQHPALAMAHISLKIALILDASRPCLLSLTV